MRILVIRQILMKNLNTQPHPRQNTSTHHQNIVNAIEAIGIFRMNNTNTYKMFENTFNFNTLEDIHDYYLKDVFLLADVFKKFIFPCLKYSDLDPCHPGLSWNSIFRITGKALEKTSDPDKQIFFEQGVNYINKKRILKHLKMSISFIWTLIIYMDPQGDNICL